MPKVTLAPLVSGFLDVDALNSNWTALATALDNTVSRDGSLPNSMSASFDMNSNYILNVRESTSLSAAATVGQLRAASFNYVIQRTQTIVATAAQTVFVLTEFTYQPGQNNIAVYVNGVRLFSPDYTETSPSQVTLDPSVTILNGDEVSFVVNQSQGTLDDIPSHTHTVSQITDLVSYLAAYTGFDARYYTETEANALLDAKASLAGAAFTGNISTTGTLSRKNADSGTLTAQPRIFVQSGDPGAAAADGDIWMW